MRDRFDPLRRIPLTAVLRACGAQPDRYDKAKWHTSEGTISITGTKFMNWHCSHGGGGAIDLAMHLNHLAFPAAVRWLERQFPIPPQAPPGQLSPRRLSLPPPDPHQLPAVTRYLLQQRAIPGSLIQSLVESGQLYADGRANAVFLLSGKENQPEGTGENLARQMMALYPRVRRLRPCLHDWNEVLRWHPQIPLPLPSE